MQPDELDLVRSVKDAGRPLSTYELARGLGITRDAALAALMAAYRSGHLTPVSSSDWSEVRWRLTGRGGRQPGAGQP
jgi:hypothetical protein